MNRVYGHGGVRDEESRQYRDGKLLLLSGLLPYQAVWLAEKSRHARFNIRPRYRSITESSAGIAIKLRFMVPMTNRTALLRQKFFTIVAKFLRMVLFDSYWIVYWNAYMTFSAVYLFQLRSINYFAAFTFRSLCVAASIYTQL